MSTPAQRASRAAAEALGIALRQDYDLAAFKVLKFGRHRFGYFHALVEVGTSEPCYVNCRFGSWFAPEAPESKRGREVISPYRDRLAELARQFEDKERRHQLQLERERESNERSHRREAEDAGGTDPAVPADRVPA